MKRILDVSRRPQRDPLAAMAIHGNPAGCSPVISAYFPPMNISNAAGIGIGIALGVGIGAWAGNIVMGIGVGLALAIAMGLVFGSRRDPE